MNDQHKSPSFLEQCSLSRVVLSLHPAKPGILAGARAARLFPKEMIPPSSGTVRAKARPAPSLMWKQEAHLSPPLTFFLSVWWYPLSEDQFGIELLDICLYPIIVSLHVNTGKKADPREESTSVPWTMVFLGGRSFHAAHCGRLWTNLLFLCLQWN